MIEMEPVVFIDNRAEIEIDHCDPDHPNYLIPTDTGYLDALLTKNGENVEEFDGNLPMNTRIGGVCEDDPIELIYSCGDETMFVGVKPSTYATLEEELGSSFDPEMLYVSVIQQNPENDTKIM